jgi:hypothetical protein
VSTFADPRWAKRPGHASPTHQEMRQLVTDLAANLGKLHHEGGPIFD